MHVRRLFVFVATLRQPELVLCTSLTRCSPCSTADQLLGAHSTALSAPAAQSDELRPVAVPQVWKRADPSCRARPHSSISAAAHPGGSAPRIPTYSTAQEHTRAFQPGSTAGMRLLLIDPALCRSTAASEPRKAAYFMAPAAPGLLRPH